MTFLSTFTTETQVCMVLVLVLLIALVSGIIGHRMGWERCIEYFEKCNIEGCG